MNEILTQIFGANNVVVGQLAVTGVVILVLLVLVIWLVRRFSRARGDNVAHNRPPRLAIVDAMPIDNRRRLILVRRDAVEHLLLIGGPSDLVVEPSIVRVRRPAQAVPGREGVPPAVGSAAMSSAANGAAAGAAVPGSAASDHARSMPSPAARTAIARAPAHAGNGHGLPILDASPNGSGAAVPVTSFRAASAAAPIERSAPIAVATPLPAHRAPPGNAPSPLLAGTRESTAGESEAHSLSDLEAEMNRLLGQLAPDTRSS